MPSTQIVTWNYYIKGQIPGVLMSLIFKLASTTVKLIKINFI